MQSGIANITQQKEVIKISVRKRIRMLRLLEKQKKHPEHAEQIGIKVSVKEKAKAESFKLEGVRENGDV